MAFNFNPAPIRTIAQDFSQLANLPDDYWKGQAKARQDAMRDELAALPLGPDGAPDLRAAATILMKNDPARGAQLLQSIQNQEAMTSYRNSDLALKERAMTLRESQPPAAPKDPYTVTSEKERAKFNAYTSRKQAQAPNLKAGLRNIKTYVDNLDNTSFENALGPLQGAEPGNIITQQLARVPRAGGEIANYFEGGKTAPTEIRNQIGGSAQALSAAIKPLVRAPGEGIWTDKDQELLDRIVGNLAESRNKSEFASRLQGVANRIQDNFGIDLSGWDAKPGSPGTEAGTQTPAGWGNASMGGDPGNESPYPEAGPQPDDTDMQKLKQFQSDPEFRAAFEQKYGKGSVDRWLNNDGWTGR
jgi:hypothetical protein